MCSLYNDPSFRFDVSAQKGQKYDGTQKPYRSTSIFMNKGDVTDRSQKQEVVTKEGMKCPLHPYALHELHVSRDFKKKFIDERRQFLKEKGIYFRCCNSDKHRMRDCKVLIKCDECKSTKHTSAMHISKPSTEKLTER